MEMDVVLLLYQLWSSWCSFRVSFSIASRCELCCEAYCANASSFSSSSSSSTSLECVLKAAEAANGLVTISCTKVAMLQSCVPFLDPRRLYRFSRSLIARSAIKIHKDWNSKKWSRLLKIYFADSLVEFWRENSNVLILKITLRSLILKYVAVGKEGENFVKLGKAMQKFVKEMQK